MAHILSNPIGIIKAEGAGPDIVEAAVSVLNRIGELNDLGFEFIEYEGEAPASKYTEESFNQLKNFYSKIKNKKGCIIRGGIFARQVYKLRHDFNLTFKPIHLEPWPELFENSPLKKEILEKMNILLIRENAQGVLMSEEEIKNTRNGKSFEGRFFYNYDLMKGFAKLCYESALGRKKKIMFLMKGDVWAKLNEMWFDVWKEVGKNYPQVEFDWEHDDTWFGYFLTNPEKFDVVVALGISGDLITDPVATLLYGSRAITPSANIAPDGFMTFQTIHGAGTQIPKGKANPIGMIRSAGLSLNYFFKKPELSKVIDSSIRKSLAKGYRTIDLYRKQNPKHTLVDCKKMTSLILNEIEKHY